jgi:tetratricopeptide (TPR) repeat protein
MRRILFLLCLVGPLTITVVWAQSLDDQYLQIYNLIQEADNSTTPSQALAKYLQAQTALQRLQVANPDWNSKLVNFRLIYVGNKIAGLSAKTPVPAVPEAKVQTGSANAQSMYPSAPNDWEAQLNGLKEQVRQLQADKILLESKLKEALAMQPAESDPRELARSEEKVRNLQKENDLLKASADAAKAKASTVVDTNALAQVRLELTQQRQLNSKLLAERQALEAQLKQSGRSNKSAAPQDQALREELLIARARLAALETRAVPYSAEELALLKATEPHVAIAEPVSIKSSKKPTNELPQGSSELVAEAKSCVATKQYDKAEAAYVKVLKQDPQCVPALASLASIQVEAQHFDAADKTIQKALALQPEDAKSLYVQGLLRFRQTNYDGALDSFSRCAKADPQNAETQVYLGLVLSEKGMRAPAENALRKAIELQPGYAGAHYNLAVIYLNQQPPAIELARWHYQKALAAGAPHDSDLEKKLTANP